MSVNPNLKKLRDLDQSVWYDNLSRDVLQSGELKGLIDAGVTGLTSNPAIFKKAIADSSDYDSEMMRLLGSRKLSTEELCEELMIQDVGAAADLLLPVYEASGTKDGHASIEVSPFLANDTEGTLSAARRLWKRLGRPNIMIKVPATPEGIPAIRALLREGINVNITLIFSVAVYEQVANAFIEALEERHEKEMSIGEIASVASFFVSRVDSICETASDALVKSGKWSEVRRNEIFGKIGIANSKLAYARFLELFGSPRFRSLEAHGAQRQRPLWASTGTKNPAFSPVMYVEELAGPVTVNTMPPQTLKSVMEQASITNRVAEGVDAARALVHRAETDGLPFDALLKDLQDQGVKLFADAYGDLLDSIGKKRSALGHG